MRHISARFAPLPPSSAFIEPLPSVFLPKRYAYFPFVAAGALGFGLCALADDFLRASFFAITSALLRLRNDFRDVRERKDDLFQTLHERQPRRLERGVVDHDEDVL